MSDVAIAKRGKAKDKRPFVMDTIVARMTLSYRTVDFVSWYTYMLHQGRKLPHIWLETDGEVC